MLAEPNPHEIAVCVVVREDGDLTRLLGALDRQSIPRFGYDLILVDATASGGLGERVPSCRFGVEVVRVDPDSSPGAAWNAGWRAVNGDAIAFVAPVVFPQVMWLAFLLGALRGGRRFATGRWLPTQQSLASAGVLSFRLWAVDREALGVTADQLGCWRADLAKVDGFDEGISDPAACAADLAGRLAESGVERFFERRMVCEYDIQPSSLRAKLAARRPAGGMVFRGAQPQALLALAGLLLTIEDLRTAVLVIPWLHHRTHIAPHAGGPRRKVFVLPGVFGVDLYDAIVGLAARFRRAVRP